MKTAFDNSQNKLITIKEYKKYESELTCPNESCSAEIEFVSYDNKTFFRSRFNNSHLETCHFNERKLSFEDIDYTLRHGSEDQLIDFKEEIELSLTKGIAEEDENCKIDIIDFKNINQKYLINEYLTIHGKATFFISEAKGKIKIAVFDKEIQRLTIWMPKVVFNFTKLPLNKKINGEFAIFGLLKDSSGFLNVNVAHSTNIKILQEKTA